MLQVLKVFNFALIEQAEIEFAKGFNVLTGETGAGKSIVIDALSVVLGGRSSVDMIRSGSDQFRVEAVFDLQQHSQVMDLLVEQAIPVEEDGLMFISRAVSRQGKNTVLINGTHAPLSLLRSLGDQLLDMHGQHENQALLRPESYIDLLDGVDSQLAALLAAYRNSYELWRQTKEKIASVDKDDRQRVQRIDMLKWQAEEIDAAKLGKTEEEELPRQIALLTNAEKISTSVGNAWSILSDGGRQGKNVTDLLQECRRNLENAARFDDALFIYVQQLSDLVVQLEDVTPGLRDYLDRIEFDPGKLSRLQERMDLIYRLKQKYGSTVAEVISYGRNARQELENLERHDEILTGLRKQLSLQTMELEEQADSLSERRIQVAESMSQAIEAHLKDLGMPGGRFSILITSNDSYSPSGKDQVRFEFSANPGEELRLLAKVASGGELSRVRLALEVVLAGGDPGHVFIFDEVDAGIGGAVAVEVGRRLARLADHSQVIVVTHLAQVAAFASAHWVVSKSSRGEVTTSDVRLVGEDEREAVLAKMMGGLAGSESGVAHARDLLSLAQRR